MTCTTGTSGMSSIRCVIVYGCNASNNQQLDITSWLAERVEKPHRHILASVDVERSTNYVHAVLFNHSTWRWLFFS